MNRLITLLFHDIYVSSPSESGFTGSGADRYKLSMAAFEAQLRAVADARADAPVLVTDLPRNAGSLPPFAISVDDGGLSYHSLLAPCLDDRGWRGHCLITTSRLGRAGFLHKHHVRELHAEGHLIGSHSVSHPARFDNCSWEQLVAEWAKSKAVLEDIIGERIVVGSIPGGYYAPRVALAARAAGLDILFTSEPETDRRDVGGCQVFGRFTLRGESPPGLAGRLVQGRGSAQQRQWLAWNAKKVLKKSLGTGYVRLSGWLAR